MRECRNIYLKDPIEKNWHSQSFNILSLKNSFPVQISVWQLLLKSCKNVCEGFKFSKQKTKNWNEHPF